MVILFLAAIAVIAVVTSVGVLFRSSELSNDAEDECEFNNEGCSGKPRDTLLRIGSGKGLSEYFICESCENKFNEELDEILKRNL